MLYTILMYFAKQEKRLLNFYDDYSSMVSGAKNRTTKRLGLKILTPKQMLLRLPVALAQVKAGNNPESLLNETNCLFFVSTKKNH